ncbi:hypothetical protein M501DRAFT_1017811 [Patellaria atrata CBS 101060]|uniref:Uncharacterized protein n=1 Tax=Patellaria atrata CBS 101060 TaxID=1346257 RepID=A0A9P4S7H8_9PEZI|nr:hypothetical protein M501DRAFT_1017811 [Patellaria atrata CBS 101060]
MREKARPTTRIIMEQLLQNKNILVQTRTNTKSTPPPPPQLQSLPLLRSMKRPHLPTVLYRIVMVAQLQPQTTDNTIELDHTGATNQNNSAEAESATPPPPPQISRPSYGAEAPLEYGTEYPSPFDDGNEDEDDDMVRLRRQAYQRRLEERREQRANPLYCVLCPSEPDVCMK